jgi:hypothetical protein
MQHTEFTLKDYKTQRGLGFSRKGIFSGHSRVGIFLRQYRKGIFLSHSCDLLLRHSRKGIFSRHSREGGNPVAFFLDSRLRGNDGMESVRVTERGTKGGGERQARE